MKRSRTAWLVFALGACSGSGARTPASPGPQRHLGGEPREFFRSCAETPLALDWAVPVDPAEATFVVSDAHGTTWLLRRDAATNLVSTVGYDAEGHIKEHGAPFPLRDIAGLRATPRGLAAFGWDAERRRGVVQWLDAHGSPRAAWEYPGSMTPLDLGGHADGSVTLVLSFWEADTTLYGVTLHGPGVPSGAVNVDARPAYVAVRLGADDALRWLAPLPQAGDRNSGGLATAADGRVAFFWGQPRRDDHAGPTVEVWDAAGRRTWQSPLHSAEAAAFDASGALVTAGAVAARQWTGPLVHSSPPADGPGVIDRYGREFVRHELCPDACAGALGTDTHGHVFYLGGFVGRTLFGASFAAQEPAAPPAFGLVAFDGDRPLACAVLGASRPRLAVGADGRVRIVTGANDEPVRINDGVVAQPGLTTLLQLSLTSASRGR